MFNRLNKNIKEDFEKYALKNQDKDFIKKEKGKIKYYLHEINKKQIKTNDWLDIKSYDYNSSYPTAKHTDMLDRLIEIFSNKDDLVADFFCGSGVTLKSCLNKKRKFIGCDGQKEAINMIKKYMKDNKITEKLDIIEMNKNTNFEKIKNDHEFARQCVLLKSGVPSYRKSNDMGVDGIRIKDGALIQVKRGVATRPQAQSLVGEMTARKQKRGLFIAKSFPETVKDWVYSLRKDGFVIDLITIQDISNDFENKKESLKESLSEEVA